MGIQLNGITGDIITPGDIGIGGTLTYEDVANVDSIGIVTARAGINVSGGTGTFAGNINANGNIVGDNSTNISGINAITATSFSGSGANLTSLPAANITGTLPAISGANLTSLPAQATIANNADNRVITGGSGVNLNGEANLTYDGTDLTVTGSNTKIVVDSRGSNGDQAHLQLLAKDGSGNNNFGELEYDGDGDFSISSRGSGSANNSIVFKTTSSNVERLRITSTGQIRIDQATSANNGIRMRPSGWNYDFRMGAVSSSGGSIWLGQNYEPTGGTRDNASYGTNYLRFTTGGEIILGTGPTNTNPTERFKITNAGAVTKPTTPAFMAYGGSASITAGNYIICDTEAYDIQNNYNTSNGIFTAPIAGRYLFTITGLYTNNNSTPPHKSVWHINNANSGVLSEWQDGSIASSYNTIGNSSIIFQLAANDTVRLYVEGGTFHISGGQTRYCGYLLG